MTRTASNAKPAASGRRSKGGFALLVIFLIAAAVAFTMYQELPRAAFESARDKEQVLMDRGNQYKRAIQVFYAVNKRYPAEIKDLENTNEKRFLRRRYIDPMTGQDEWRLIHTNGSFLTDSLVTKPPTQNAANGLPGAGQTPNGGPLGANNLNTAAIPNTPVVSAPTDPSSALAAATLQNAAALRRPSDRGFSGGPFSNAPGFQPQPGGNQNMAGGNPFNGNPASFDPNDPSTWPPITLVTPNSQPGQQPQQPGLGQRPANAQFMPGQVPGGGAGQPLFGIPGQLPGQGGSNPQPAVMINANPQNDNLNQPQFVPSPDGQTPPLPNQPTPQQQLGPSFPQPGASLPQPSAAQQQANLVAAGFNPQNPAGVGAQPNPALPGNNAGNAALTAIDTALFRPNQAPATGPTGSPGIAGVASKFEGPSIKAYRERTKYQEWEFVYEPITNQPGQAGAPGQTPQQNPLGPNPPATGAGQIPGVGQTPAGGAMSSNPFSMPNPFAPVPAAR